MGKKKKTTVLNRLKHSTAPGKGQNAPGRKRGAKFQLGRQKMTLHYTGNVTQT